MPADSKASLLTPLTEMEREELKLRKKGKGKGKQLHEATGPLRVSDAKFLLEVWILPKEKRRIQSRVVTILWVNGEALAPGGDMVIFECPSVDCSGLFLPGFEAFTKPEAFTMIPERDSRGRPTGKMKREPIPLVVCPKCKRIYPRAALIDSRGCAGTWDVLGKHLAFRYQQLFGDADLLVRVMREDMFKQVPAILAKERGARDKYIGAQNINRKDMMRWTNDQIMKRITGGTPPEVVFKQMLKA